ncbi:hypothetical protein N4T20_20595 [Flavobacterium sp. TR2]|uniref:hypothetical protein n=1 Tax=Flavobacterium sp. TR2 TaxID=2977321 RepID=UPI0021B14C3D|nr:hypothetical protein [Flavobacterium sp. TR2]UWY28108.1 hypothetical protein N4T20_20595 [Flavobacterium sp. TR2]
MKTLYLWGAYILLSTTLFSCTADEFETAKGKTEVKTNTIPAKNMQATGPDDDPVVVPPPPKK